MYVLKFMWECGQTLFFYLQIMFKVSLQVKFGGNPSSYRACLCCQISRHFPIMPFRDVMISITYALVHNLGQIYTAGKSVCTTN